MTLDAAGWRRRGNELAKSGTRKGYQESIECYSSGIELLQSDQAFKGTQLRARLLSCRAHVRLLLGGDEEALAAVSDCKSAIKDDPHDSKTYWRAAKASSRLRLQSQAVDFCRRGLDNAGSAELRQLLAELDDDVREAAESQAMQEEIPCTHSFEFRDAGLSNFRADVLASFRAAVAADPTDADAHCNLGVTLAQHGDEAEALQCFEAAVRSDPRHVGAHRNLADAHREQGNFAAAEHSYREVLRLAPDEAGADVHFGLGVSLGQRGDQVGAMASFRAAVDADPQYADAWLGLGIACEASADAEGAVCAFRAAAAAAPRNAAAQHNLGLALERLAQAGVAESSQLLFDAEVALHTACALDPNNADSQCQLGVVLLRTGKIPDAKAAFEQSLRLDPTHQGAQENAEALCRICDSMSSAALDSSETNAKGGSREAWAEDSSTQADVNIQINAFNSSSDPEL